MKFGTFCFFGLFFLLSQTARAGFPDMAEEVKDGDYRVTFECSLENMEQLPYWSGFKKFPELVGKKLYIMNSNKWFITRVVVGDQKNPNWVSRRLYNQTGVFLEDDFVYSFSYNSIGGGYHSLLSVDKVSGRGHFKLEHVDALRFIGEGNYTFTKIHFKDCQFFKMPERH